MQPRTIFEQILFGVQVTNENVVETNKLVQKLAVKVDAVFNALFLAPNTVGADAPVEEPVKE